eukprot:jgi/Botrbrau1/19777/Bobra.0124s0028.1
MGSKSWCSCLDRVKDAASEGAQALHNTVGTVKKQLDTSGPGASADVDGNGNLDVEPGATEAGSGSQQNGLEHAKEAIAGKVRETVQGLKGASVQDTKDGADNEGIQHSAGSTAAPTFDIGLQDKKMPKDYPGAERDERISAAQAMGKKLVHAVKDHKEGPSRFNPQSTGDTSQGKEADTHDRAQEDKGHQDEGTSGLRKHLEGVNWSSTFDKALEKGSPPEGYPGTDRDARVSAAQDMGKMMVHAVNRHKEGPSRFNPAGEGLSASSESENPDQDLPSREMDKDKGAESSFLEKIQETAKDAIYGVEAGAAYVKERVTAPISGTSEDETILPGSSEQQSKSVDLDADDHVSRRVFR